jgi:hypothetical protein
MRAVTAAEAQLAAWLHRLVTLLQEQGAAVAGQLAATVAGRRAVLWLDDARLALSASRGASGVLVIEIGPADGTEAAQLRTTGDALREVIEGRFLLDAAVASGRIDVRATLPDLLAFHELVVRALALGPRDPALLALWAEFDRAWPGSPLRCLPIDQQAPRHGELRQHVPASVQHAKSPLFDSDASP